MEKLEKVFNFIFKLFFSIELWTMVVYIDLILTKGKLDEKEIVVYITLICMFCIKVINKKIQSFIDILKNERN